ncbi:MAG TPA: MBL fold metallo-hydrolase [Thermomicrobiaceae bacterium]|nr:MBL fold metallo-hydrolase [Thermomicrobiaceae bacterium]
MTSLAQDFIDTREVGAAKVTIVSEGGLRWAPRFSVPDTDWLAAAPDADDEGRVPLGLNSAIIQLGNAIVLLDPCLDDAGSAASDGFLSAFTDTYRTAGRPAALQQLGIDPSDVALVIITHTHDDHLTGITETIDGEDRPRFPNARYLVGAADCAQNLDSQAPVEAQAARCLRVVDRAGLLERVDHEVEPLPGLTVIPAPGESPGHQIVRLQSNGETFFYVGDLLHHAAEVEHPTWVSPYRDNQAMIQSRRRLLEEAAGSGALVVFTHAQFPGWGRIARAGDGFRWEWVS